MPKKRRKTNEAWKNIVKSHARGPKRVRLKRKVEEDENEGDDILTQHIQLIIDENKGRRQKYVIIKVSKVTLQKLRLPTKSTFLPNQTKKHELCATFNALDHNALVMGEMKLIPLRIATYCGPHVCEALVYGGTLLKPNNTIHIATTREEGQQMVKTKDYVNSLFYNKIHKQQHVKVEYI